MVFTAQQIASYTGGTVEGNPETVVSTFAKIEEGVEGALSFLANLQYEHYLYETKSSKNLNKPAKKFATLRTKSRKFHRELT